MCRVCAVRVQVKMLTFLTFFLRGVSREDSQFKTVVSDCIRHMLLTLPANAVSVSCCLHSTCT